MKNTLLATAIAACVATTANAQSWTIIPSGTGMCNLRSVVFGDNNTVYATGDWSADSSTLLKSTNAGLSFSHLSLSFLPPGHLTGRLSFLNADTGYITSCITTGSAPWTYSAGTIYRTVNGGLSWTPVASGIAGGVTEMEFADASTGYATVSGGFSTPFSLYKTSDGGLSWAPIYTSTSAITVSDLVLVDAATGYILAQDASHQATLIRISGGAVGTLSTFPAYTFFECGHFSSATNGLIAAGTAGTAPAFYILKTTDGGSTFSPTYTSGHNHQAAMEFDGTSTGFTVGGSGLQTSDGGLTWSAMDTASFYGHGSPFDMAIRNGVRIIVGEAGSIWRQGGTAGASILSNQLAATIFPNPASQSAEIDFGKTVRGTMSVYDMTGRLMQTMKVDDRRATLDVHNMPPGTYSLTLRSADGILTKNIVVR